MPADERNGGPVQGDLDMVTTGESDFSRAIEEHLSLKKRNAALGGTMPIERYEVTDPMENHPLFKSEEQARLEETIETVPSGNGGNGANGSVPVIEESVAAPNGSSALPWPGESEAEGPALDEGLWGKSRDFDWGE